MDTRVMKLCCQGCGADLQVTEEVRFVTCNYCQSKLEIVRDASVTHTRVLEKLERTTERIAGNLKVIELQNDLERLDREWERVRQSLMTRGKDDTFMNRLRESR
jgi:DNA-directed RNA polymerase subunit RPC12/RpoP